MNFETHFKSKKTLWIVGGVLALYLVAHYLLKPKALEVVIPTVEIQKPEPKEVTSYVYQTGTTVAYQSVDLVARIEGYLNSVDFTDGSFVKKGQQLLVIQPEPYMDQLKAAQATVAAQKAAYAYSKSEYARQQRMYKQNATSLNNVEKWLAKTQEYQAEVAKAIANEDIAAINYSYTHISAPFNGRIGRHLVDPGNLVGNGQATDLATLEQIDPIYVYFNLSELDLIKLRAAAKNKGMKAGDLNSIPAYIKLQTDKEFIHKGHMDFVNTGLNASTGTMEFRAILENKDYTLLPGYFVQVRIPVTEAKKELTVPDIALQYDQIGAYLLVVDANNVVQMARVELGHSDQGRTPVLKGISAQDKIIVRGLQFATPGGKVTIQEPQPSKDEKTKS